MKLARIRALPYPLLSPLADDVLPNAFELSCPPGSIGVDESSWHITGRIQHQCPDLQELVRSGMAQFGIHIECPRTLYRGWFPQESSEIKVTLPAKEVRGRVELLAVCAAKVEIPEYRIDGMHEDYGDNSFKIRPGDFLAIARHLEFDAFLDLDPLHKISSILDIKKSKDRKTGPSKLDFMGDHIEVELSKDDFANYIELRADPMVRGLLVNGVVFPAILHAINYLLNLKPDELEDAKAQQRWCRSLIARLEKNGVQLKSEAKEVYRAAQEILREPISRGLKDLLAVWKE